MKRYQDLSFVDDFMFCKVMTTNPELCRRILVLILKKKIKKIEIHGAQQARAEGIIKSGRRHLFSDEVIIEDIMTEIGCDLAHAKKMLKTYDARSNL